MQNVIFVGNATKSYDGATKILNNLNLIVSEGEFVSILGESGSGKSTLLYALAGLEKIDSGEIHVLNQNISEMTSEKLARFRLENLGFVHQAYNLLTNMNIQDNVMLPLILLKRSKDAQKRVDEVLEFVGLQGRNKCAVTQLSGGEQQRVAVARAIIHSPKLLLADEATGNLDSHNAQKIMELFKNINAQYGTTIIQVTHSANMASYSARQISIIDGKINEDEISLSPKIQ